MGNCAFRSNAEPADSSLIKVVTSNGGVLELYPPVTAESITNGFPSHAIYRSREEHSQPLFHNEELIGGHSYYLRPLNGPLSVVPSAAAPYRVSFGQHGLWRRQEVEALSSYNSSVWKVKLLIKRDDLLEILSQESRTEALIESVRTVAKYVAAAAVRRRPWRARTSGASLVVGKLLPRMPSWSSIWFVQVTTVVGQSQCYKDPA